MAKKRKMAGPKFNVKHPSAPTAISTALTAKREDQYKIEDDARTVRSYGKLRSDSDAHGKALNLIRSENAMVADLESRSKGGGMQPRIKARQGRRRAARSIGRA